MTTIIIAGNYQQYRDYLRKEGIPRTLKNYRYVNRLERIRGLGKGAHVIFTGTYMNNPLWGSPEFHHRVDHYNWRLTYENE